MLPGCLLRLKCLKIPSEEDDNIVKTLLNDQKLIFMMSE